MRAPAQIRWLPDGKRLHLNDGPIDLVVEAFGDQDQVQVAYRAAATRFVTVLDELCQELPLLRKPMLLDSVLPTGVVARRMSRAYVNNGGDIAFYLASGQRFVAGMIERPDRASLLGTVTLRSDQPSRGLATSGWRGRSFSLGIADAVTVLARSASLADAAATVIANAVDLPGPPRNCAPACLRART